jgi:hypothetical protein
MVLKGLSCSMSMVLKRCEEDGDRDQAGPVCQVGAYISYCKC